MNKRFFGKAIALLLVLTMCFGLGCAEKDNTRTIAGYALEPSEGTYSYVVHTPHATWHLAEADIALLGEDAFFAGLSETLVHQEADFSDAIAALSGYLDEVPVIDIYTDFSGRTETAKLGAYGAYCRWNVPCIEVYSDFTMAKMALLHEYTHYLTHCCFAYAVDGNFWSEAIAEYVSRIVCKNRMACSTATEEDLKGLAAQGMLDADGGPSLEKVYRASSAMIRSGALIGSSYSTVSQAPMQMTEQLLAHPMLTTLSYHEAGCFFDWLAEHYGKDLVFSHMTIGQGDFKDVFGKDFETLFFAWAADNDAWCAENGIVLGPVEE